MNTASVPLLTRISGLNATLASNIVAHRDANGAFTSRKALLKGARLGDKTFEQAAGFLRIMNGDNPLDASAVHPRPTRSSSASSPMCKKSARELIADANRLKQLDAAKYTDERFGLPTVQDILRNWKNRAATLGRNSRPRPSATASKVSRTSRRG